MTATAENPSETRDQTPEQTISNFDRTRIELALTESNKTAGIFTAVAMVKDRPAIANASGVSDTAVRKALKAFKQVLPEAILMADNKRLTELAQALMAQYFSRPEGMTGAEWIYELRQVIGALPEAMISPPSATPNDHWDRVKADQQKECTALATTAESQLERLRSLLDSDDIGEDESFELELKRRRELAYKREIALQLAEVEGRAQARMDIRKGA
jgi:hypothetical protein